MECATKQITTRSGERALLSSAIAGGADATSSQARDRFLAGDAVAVAEQSSASRTAK